MKVCPQCGEVLADNAVMCSKCGHVLATQQTDVPSVAADSSNSGLKTAAKVFMIIGTVFTSILTYLIGLAWCLPMTIVYFVKVKNGEKVPTGFKVCTLLFVNVVAGILMLCDKE